MKKVLALLLALALVFALAACGSEPAADAGTKAEEAPKADSGAKAPEAGSKTAEGADVGGTVGSTKPYPHCNEDGSINLDTIAHFDHEYDYTQNPRFKAVYLSTESTPLYTEFADCMTHWCEMFNLEYLGFYSTNGDADMFMTTLQNYLDQGVELFILDPDAESYPIVAKFMADYPNVSWCGRMSAPRDCEVGEGIAEGGNMLGWYVGFDHYIAGQQCTDYLLQWKEDNLADISWDDIGLLTFDFSASSQLHIRVKGTYDTFEAAGANMDNFFVADCVSSGLTMQGGIDVGSPVIATHGEFKYWLVQGSIDDWAQAAASILDQQGLTDTSCVVAFGGANLMKQWDAGQYDSFRAALYTANALYCEPVLGGVYAMQMGWAEPETLWPSYINWNDCGGEGHTFAQLPLPTVWLEPDSYQHYLAWCDLYADSNIYGYTWDGLTMDDFSPFVDEIPASYAKQ